MMIEDSDNDESTYIAIIVILFIIIVVLIVAVIYFAIRKDKKELCNFQLERKKSDTTDKQFFKKSAKSINDDKDKEGNEESEAVPVQDKLTKILTAMRRESLLDQTAKDLKDSSGIQPPPVAGL